MEETFAGISAPKHTANWTASAGCILGPSRSEHRKLEQIEPNFRRSSTCIHTMAGQPAIWFRDLCEFRKHCGSADPTTSSAGSGLGSKPSKVPPGVSPAQKWGGGWPIARRFCTSSAAPGGIQGWRRRRVWVCAAGLGIPECRSVAPSCWCILDSLWAKLHTREHLPRFASLSMAHSSRPETHLQVYEFPTSSFPIIPRLQVYPKPAQGSLNPRP